MIIYLIRHGETDWNVKGKVQGREDIKLNSTGVIQATKCGQALKKIDIDCIVASPLKRAQKTAEIIGEFIGIDNILIEDDLIEKDFGRLSGLTQKQIKIEISKGFAGEEDWGHIVNRMMRALEKYANMYENKNVVMVSHGASINAVLSVLSSNTIGTGKTELKNSCINILKYENNIFNIERYNLSSEEFTEYINNTNVLFT